MSVLCAAQINGDGSSPLTFGCGITRTGTGLYKIILPTGEAILGSYVRAQVKGSVLAQGLHAQVTDETDYIKRIITYSQGSNNGTIPFDSDIEVVVEQLYLAPPLYDPFAPIPLNVLSVTELCFYRANGASTGFIHFTVTFDKPIDPTSFNNLTTFIVFNSIAPAAPSGPQPLGSVTIVGNVIEAESSVGAATPPSTFNWSLTLPAGGIKSTTGETLQSVFTIAGSCTQ